MLPPIVPEKEISINLKEFFRANKRDIQNSLSENFIKSLPEFFSTEEETFRESSISIQINLDEVLAKVKKTSINYGIHIGDEMFFKFSKVADSFDLILTPQGNATEDYMSLVASQFLSKLFLTPWIESDSLLLPAERGGLNLFYQELNARRTSLFHKTPLSWKDFTKNIPIARYPRPIADYIDLLNDTGVYKRRNSDFRDLATALQNEVLGGNYSLDGENGISFQPHGVEHSLGFHLSSSTAKTYFGLWFYLKHMAYSGDVLMIDEPELNLHPDNQRRIARILARMVKRGIRVVLSTHSDYLVREFNNLIVLAHEFPERDELRAKFGYAPEDYLDQDCVGAYCFGDNTIKKMEISPDEGIIAETFDKVINELNDSSYELASAWAEHRAEQAGDK